MRECGAFPPPNSEALARLSKMILLFSLLYFENTVHSARIDHTVESIRRVSESKGESKLAVKFTISFSESPTSVYRNR